VQPQTGTVAGGDTVAIRGIGLTCATGATSVRFAGVDAASLTVVDDPTITAVTPSVVAGSVDVTVTVPQPYGSTWPAAFTFQ